MRASVHRERSHLSIQRISCSQREIPPQYTQDFMFTGRDSVSVYRKRPSINLWPPQTCSHACRLSHTCGLMHTHTEKHLFPCVHVCAWVSVCVPLAHRYLWRPEGTRTTELELQTVIVSHLLWMLRPEPEFSKTAASHLSSPHFFFSFFSN